MKATSSALLLALLSLGCGSGDKIAIPTATVGALKESEVTQMGRFGKNAKIDPIPAPPKQSK